MTQPEDRPNLTDSPPLEPAQQAPAEPDANVEDIPYSEEAEEELEPAPRWIDPAFMLIVLVVIVVIGLNRIDVEVRYALIWTVMLGLAVAAIALDKIEVGRLTLSGLFIGIGFGALIGLPVLAVGAPSLRQISLDIFGKASDISVFQMLAFTMPLAEALYFRAALQSARSSIFAGIAGGIWSVVLFFPQLFAPPLNVFKLPLLAVMIGLCFVFVNSVYSYVRNRFGLFASWMCQITLNLLLLFVARFMV